MRERADATYGASAALSLFRLLADAEAADSADELISVYNNAVSFGEGDSLSIDFAPQCRARFVPVNAKQKGADDLDWSQVKRLKLVQVRVAPNV